MEGSKTSIVNLKVAPLLLFSGRPLSPALTCSVFDFHQIADGFPGEPVRENTKTFTYDFSYDSTDRQSSAFTSQEKVRPPDQSGLVLPSSGS